MTVSTTVPGGGLESWLPLSSNMRLLILFFTTTTENLGLKNEHNKEYTEDGGKKIAIPIDHAI